MVRASWQKVAFLAILLAAFLGYSFVAYGQLDVTAVTSRREVPPNEFVSLTYSVVNNSGTEREVQFELSVPDGWSPMDTPSPTTIPAGGSDTVFITVQVPATAQAGDHPVELAASYDGETYTGTATVTVTEVQEVTVSTPAAKTVGRDSSLSYVFTVRNTGNVTDTFEIEADSGHDWVTNYSPKSLDLFPGSSKEVEVELYVPDDAVPGRDPVTVTATSTRDDEIVTEATVYTRILPPSPQAVGGELYAILPARLEGSFNREVGDGEPTGSLNLVADGELGQGDLYFDFGLSEIHTENELDWNDLDYSWEDFRISTGNVGLTFSELMSKSGRGIAASLPVGDFNLSLLDLFGDLYDSGGQLSYERDDLYLAGNISNLETGEDQYSLTETVVARYSGEGAVEAELEAGYTPSGGDYGQAYRGYGQVGFDLITLEGESFFIGPDFAGNSSGDKGFRFSQSATGENFSQNLNYSYYYQTPNQAQRESTVLTDRLSGSARLDLLGVAGGWPEGREGRAFNLSGSATFSNRKDVRDERDLDENTQSFTGSFLYRYDYVDFSLSATQELRTNNLSGQSFEYFDMEQTVGFNYEGIYFTAEFSNSLTENLTTDERVSTSRTTTFTLETSGEPYIGLSMTKRGASMDFGLDSTVSPSENIELSLSADATFGEDFIDIGGTLDFTYDFDLPLEFIVTKGRVDGYVFVDENENGEKDEGEEGISDLVLNIENTSVATGEDGYFKFPPFTPGTYELAVDDLPSRYGALTELPLEVEVTKGEENTVEIPLTELSEMEVSVFSDENENGERNTGEGGVEGVGLRLTSEEFDRERFTNEDGIVNFRGLQPGEYTLTLQEDTLPPRSEVTTGNAEMSFTLAGGEAKEVEIGSFQRPREIVFGQPPEADFAYSPETPRVGEQVNYSGGLSEDPDGEITSYEWDFDGDGEVDETGMIVSSTFSEAGSYEVTLTVTDDDGNDASVTKEIEVRRGEGNG